MRHHKAERHLEPDDLVDARGACPLCGHQGEREPVFVIQENPRVAWLFCASCMGYSASWMPTDRYLDDYYATFYGPGDTGVTVGRPARLADHVASLLPVFEKDHLSILDFGGGDGAVARFLAGALKREHPKRNFSITLVDFHLEPDLETEEYSLKSENDLEGLGGDYDIILASAILEHVPRMKLLIHQLFARLGEGGFFYARTPCVVPLKKLAPTYPLQYPMHVHDLGPSFWNRVHERERISVELLVSQPSMVATGLRRGEITKTLVASLLKSPAHFEHWLRRSPRDYFWRWVGGWEVLFQRTEEVRGHG